MEEFILFVLRVTALELIGVLGVFFFFGIVLHYLEKYTHKRYLARFGWKGILWTAWIGTPIHELGHALFAKIFRHKIISISLFQPDKLTGNLGHVDHSYDKKSIYQQVGNFFVAIAPLLFGLLAIYGFGKLLLPSSAILLPSGESIRLVIISSFEAIIALFQPEFFRQWQFWLFLYLAFAITSHMAPSTQDLRGMYRGLAWIIGLLVLINIICYIVGIDPTTYISTIQSSLSIVVSLFLYATLLSLLHAILATIFIRKHR